MRTKNLALAMLAVAMASTAVLADAQPSTDRAEKVGEKAREKFNAADTDHDGLLSRDEATKGMPRVAKHFDAIDANHDGKISLQEIAQFMNSKRAAHNEEP
jgi:Ca2+-binding EF-hand superfamily protein